MPDTKLANLFAAVVGSLLIAAPVVLFFLRGAL